jgi:hypothetical protein
MIRKLKIGRLGSGWPAVRSAKTKQQNSAEQDVVQTFKDEELRVVRQGERCDILILEIPCGLFFDRFLHIDVAPILIEICTTGRTMKSG